MGHVTDNEMILASAGSGKTYQLTNRYIGLLADGREPETIVALTFTRKAAGEFFEAILEKLASSAASPEAAAELSAQLGRSDLTDGHFRQMLRTFIDRMPKLTLGTLDSFFSGIMRNFPFEFGLGGGFQILDDHLGTIERHRVYRQVFQRNPSDRSGQAEFLESFKLATYGREESSLTRQLDEFVSSMHDLFMTAPGAEKWGNPATIWPDGSPWSDTDGDYEPLFRALFEAFDSDELDPKHRDKWDKFAEELPAHTPGSSLSYELKFMLERLLTMLPELESGCADIKMFRKAHSLTPSQCEPLLAIVRGFVARELDVRLRRTRGVWSLLSSYEAGYATIVRRTGKLSFFDLSLILAGAESSDSNRRMLAQQPGDDTRLLIDFRLDARFHHWLLDEFQDTSRLQWRVLENLIDEAIQDISGERTFFQVGDKKQAIYAWRGGDVKLFDEIRDQYASSARPLIPRPLNTSYRSCPAVIEAVNRVFGDRAALATVCGEAAIARWDWGDHVAQNDGWSGYTGLFQAEDTKGDARDREEARYAIMLELLRETDPIGRGLSCAILVRSNPQGERIVDYIRAHSDISVINESDIAVARDNPLCAALLSLFQFAAHPSDRFAEQHLRMTPFMRAFEKAELSFAQISDRVLRSVQRNGFEATIEEWLDRLQSTDVELDAFSQRRAGEISNAAFLFDQSGSRDISEFVAFARNYSLREPALRGVVQVLTIHKSKGLGYDIVFLPDLGGKSLDKIDEKVAVHRDEAGEIEWILQVPPQVLSNADATLACHHDEAKSDAAYEELCVHYVAMTRAKRANYLIIDPIPRTSTARAFSNLLANTLPESDPVEFGSNGVTCQLLYETGSRDWWSHPSARPKPPAPPRPERGVSDQLALRPFTRGRRRTPSESGDFGVPASLVFSRGGGDARAFGKAVHATFESIEWLDAWQAPEAKTEIERRALETVKACLSQPAVAALFTRDTAEPPAKVWREQRFEMFEDGQWISGAIDRAHIWSDRAEIIDFKTDRSPTADSATKYDGQLRLYREALSKLTGLPTASIAARLVFTTTAQVVDVA